MASEAAIEKATQVVEAVLFHVNGYERGEAKKYAPSEKGSEFFNELLEILSD